MEDGLMMEAINRLHSTLAFGAPFFLALALGFVSRVLRVHAWTKFQSRLIYLRLRLSARSLHSAQASMDITPSPLTSTTVSGTGSPQKHRLEDDDVSQRPSGGAAEPSPRKKQKQDHRKQDEPKKSRRKQRKQTQEEQHKNEWSTDTSEPINSDTDETDLDHLQTENPQPHTPPQLTDPHLTLVTPGTSVTFGIEDLSSAKLTVYGSKLNSLLKVVKMAEDNALATGEAKTSNQCSKFLQNALDFLVCPNFPSHFAPCFVFLTDI
jgi:hypothetical protein